MGKVPDELPEVCLIRSCVLFMFVIIVCRTRGGNLIGPIIIRRVGWPLGMFAGLLVSLLRRRIARKRWITLFARIITYAGIGRR